MNSDFNNLYRILFASLITFSATTSQALAEEEGTNFNVPVRLFAVTVPRLRTNLNPTVTTDPNATDPNATDPNATDSNATDSNATDSNATDSHRIDIPIKAGKGRVKPFALSNHWKIYGGTILYDQPASLKPIIVELHGTVGPIRKIIARVIVKYYSANDSGSPGWKPLYQLNQEPIIVKTPTGWRPLFGSRDSPEILGVLNREHPNSAGFRPYIDFKLFKGKASIDSWVVKRQQ